MSIESPKKCQHVKASSCVCVLELHAVLVVYDACSVVVLCNIISRHVFYY